MASIRFSAASLLRRVSVSLSWSSSSWDFTMPQFPLQEPPVTKGGYGKITRKRDPTHLKEITAHASEIGRVLFEWNQLHVELAMLFASVLPDSTEIVLAAIWHSHASDSGQRNMLLESAHCRYWNDPVHYKRIKWIIQMADKMSSYRNLAAHLAMEIHDDTSGGRAFLLPDRLSAKRAANVRAMWIKAPAMKKDFWALLADDLYVLQQYARIVFFATTPLGRRVPLPRKPRLLSLPEIRRTEDWVRRITKRPLWSRLLRASRRKP